MNINEIINTMLNGEIIHDGLIIGICLICFYTFYSVIFTSMFSIFNRK